jgi:hypothetical protein
MNDFWHSALASIFTIAVSGLLALVGWAVRMLVRMENRLTAVESLLREHLISGEKEP